MRRNDVSFMVPIGKPTVKRSRGRCEGSGPGRRVPMTFQSILFEKREDSIWPEPSQAPACFADLNLDQVVDTITSGREEYHLKPLFAIPLKEVRAVEYRQEI